MNDIMITEANAGNADKGQRMTLVMCIIDIFVQLLVVFNFMHFTNNVSFHKFIPSLFEFIMICLVVLIS